MTRRNMVVSLLALAQPVPLASDPPNRNAVWNSIGKDIQASNETMAVIFKWLKDHEKESNPPLDAGVFEALNRLEFLTDNICRKVRQLRKALRGDP